MSLPNELAAGAIAQRMLNIRADGGTIDEEKRTIELAFSSEEPYERWWGIEILDHGKKSVDLKRLKNGGPLLVDHDTRDHVGVIESVRIDDDRVGRAIVRFGRSARAEEVFRDVVDGIRQSVSVGYRINEAVLEGEKDGISTYRVKNWQPYEVSLVSVPADATVGVGRSAEEAAAATPPPVATEQPTQITQIEERKMDVTQERAAGAEAEQKRSKEIIAIAGQYEKTVPELRELATQSIVSGLSVEEFRAKAMEAMAKAPKPTAELGMEKAEVQRYSVLRAINALANPTDARAQREAAFELECSREAEKRSGKPAQGLIVPFDVLSRVLTVGAPTAGGNLVATDLLAGSFIDVLRNAMVIDGLGTQWLDGLVGNIAIPRQTAGATAYWVSENGTPTTSQPAVDQVSMSPKTVGTYTDISRKLMNQASLSVEAMVRNDLAQTLGRAIQLAAIQGGGSNEPTGILGTVGIGDVAGGTAGLAPAWSHIVDLESKVSIANADIGSLAYLTNAKVRGALKKTSKVSGQNGFIWEGGDAPLNGYRAAVTNAVPSNLVKGGSGSVCSAIIFGNFADLLIGMWGGLDLLADPYTGSAAGTVRIRALQDVDVAVRHAESFAAMKDALA